MSQQHQIHWVHDYETLSDCFTAVFEDYKSDKQRIFVIGHARNDIQRLLEFFRSNIRNKERHISFNGLAFDAQITEYIIRNYKHLLALSGPEVARLIYMKAQDCIDRSNKGEYQVYNPWNLSIKQIDVYKMNGWDREGRRASLKWVQYTSDWHNVQDMPIDHTESVTTEQKLREILIYNINDVKSLKYILMEHCYPMLELRSELSKAFKTDLLSQPEQGISKRAFLHYMSERMNIEKNVLKKMRTRRNQIFVKDILLPYLRYKTKPFQKMLIRFQHQVINGRKTRGAFEYIVEYRGIQTKLALGGLHGARKGVFESNSDMMIKTSDVVSYYPNLVIRNNWAPAHLDANKFCELYEWFFDTRKSIPKKNPWNYFYKILLNATFGLSLEPHNPMYDPRLGMAITINGQLSLMMLYENLVESIPGAIPLMQNTDGVEIMIPRNQEEKYHEICTRWEKITKLQLEHDEYQKMIIPDVNNYIGVHTEREVTKEEFDELKQDKPMDIFRIENDKYYYSGTKCKGRFDFLELALHKNKSFLVNRKAVFNYFVHGIQPEQTLAENRNIYDYCAGARARRPWTFKVQRVENGKVIEQELQKTLRYYVSRKGDRIIKVNTEDLRTNNVQKNGLQTVFNIYQERPWRDYDIDERFYLEKIKTEIRNLQPGAFSGQQEMKF